MPEQCDCGAPLEAAPPEPAEDLSQWLVSTPPPATRDNPRDLIRNGLLYGHWQADLQALPRSHDAWLSGLSWGLLALLTFQVTGMTGLQGSLFGGLLSSGAPKVALWGVLPLLGTAVGGTAMAAVRRLGLKPVATIASCAGLLAGLGFTTLSLSPGLPWLVSLLILPPVLAWVGLYLGALPTRSDAARAWVRKQSVALGIVAVVGAVGYAVTPAAVPVALMRAAAPGSPAAQVVVALESLRRSTPAERQVLYLQTGDRARSQAAADAIIQSQDKNAVPHLAPLLNDERQEVREMAAYALGGLHGPESAEALARAMVAMQTPRSSGPLPVTRNLYQCFWATAPGSLQRGLQLARSGDQTDARVGAMMIASGAQSGDLPVLLQLLNGSEKDLQSCACSGLGRLREPAALDAVLKATRHANPEVRESALMVLIHSDDPRAVPTLLAAAPGTGGLATQILISNLLRDHDARVIPLLLQQIAEERNGSARYYVEQLQAMGPAAIAPLAAAATNPSPQVRKVVLGVLRQSSDSRAIAAVKACEAHMDDAWRREELEDLRWDNKNEGLAERKFVEALRVGGPDLRAWAEEEFGNFCARGHKEALARALGNSDKRVKLAALHILRKSYGATPQAPLARLLKDADPEIRAAAVPCLKDSVAAQDRPRVYASLLQDQSPLVRQATIELIGTEYGSQYVPLLLQSLKQERSPELRAAAAKALSNSHDAAAERALLAAAKDPSSVVQQAALEVLQHRQSPAAKSLVERQRAAELERVKRQLGR